MSCRLQTNLMVHICDEVCGPTELPRCCLLQAAQKVQQLPRRKAPLLVKLRGRLWSLLQHRQLMAVSGTAALESAPRTQAGSLVPQLLEALRLCKLV